MELFKKIANKPFLVTAIVALLSFPLAIASLSAAEIKVGVVNFKEAVEKSKLGKQEQTTFEGLKKQLEEVLIEKEKTLTEVAHKLNDPDYLDTLSSEAENELKHKFRTMNQELNGFQSQYYQTLQQANMKIIGALTEKITGYAKTVAQKQGLDLVLNEESSFYFQPKLDITQQVIKEMDDSFEKDGRVQK